MVPNTLTKTNNRSPLKLSKDEKQKIIINNGDVQTINRYLPEKIRPDIIEYMVL